MPDTSPDVRIAIEHSLKVLSRWTLALYLVVTLVLGAGIIARQRDTSRIQGALCVFVADMETRIGQSKAFLEKHEGEKEPIPGVTRTDLRLSIQRQQVTIDSLSGLEC